MGLGDQGGMAFYFQGAGEHWYFFRKFGEQAYSFGDLGSPEKNLTLKEKSSFCLILLKKISFQGKSRGIPKI